MGLFVQDGDIQKVKDQIKELKRQLRQMSALERVKPLIGVGLVFLFLLVMYLWRG